MANGEGLSKVLPNLNLRLEHNNFSMPVEFVADGTPSGGSDANKVFVTFSAAKSTTFTYDGSSKRYGVEQYGRADIDGNNNTQIKATNLFVIKTRIVIIPGDGAGRREIDTTGTGTGYFINGGQYVEINWHRASHDVPYSFTLKDGSPLMLGRGNSYVCIVPLDQTIRFE